MAEPQQVFDRINSEWATDWFLKNLNQVRIKLTGAVLDVQSGNLRDSVGVVSRVNPDGFTLGTNVDYGVYWEGNEDGIVEARAFGGSGGRRPARSYLRTTLQENEADMQRDLARRYERGIPNAFPNVSVDFRMGWD